MAEQQSSQDKTEQPTERRKQDSRKKGQVPRSKELNTMLSLLIAAAGILALGDAMANDFLSIFEKALSFDRDVAFDKEMLPAKLVELMLASLRALTPFFGVTILGALVGPLMMGGWTFSASALAFKLEKINPIKGLGRVFSAKGLIELVKTIAKFTLLSGAAILLFGVELENILYLSTKPPHQALVESLTLLQWGLLTISATMIFIVFMDVPFELWNHNKQLKMTLQEVKDELKESEGRPEVKARIRSLQREMSQRRMMEDVPTADVIITNPTHFAVALRYDIASSAAPKVLAKGQDLIALKIRSVASENDVAIFSAPPLARALYHSTEIGDEIPQNLFLAVARVLAYVFQLRKAGNVNKPTPPEELPIPTEYQDKYPGRQS